MTTKIAIPGIAGFALLIACAKPYQPAGSAPALDASGSYATTESLYSSTCSGFAARKEKFVIQVEHASGGLSLKLVADGMPWDAKIQRDGNFSALSQTIQRGPESTTTTITGRFTETAMFARVSIRRVEPVVAVRPGEPTTRICDYQLRWEAKKQ